ncbi:hypothetical protein E4U35_000342 [Claviceps purpurea]|nr:hypothetical protein E4U35_000342 [Claviceps purpurea]KAG6256261.1 hypothetical protein E4U23_002576 [Claviceps purpurea]
MEVAEHRGVDSEQQVRSTPHIVGPNSPLASGSEVGKKAMGSIPFARHGGAAWSCSNIVVAALIIHASQPSLHKTHKTWPANAKRFSRCLQVASSIRIQKFRSATSQPQLGNILRMQRPVCLAAYTRPTFQNFLPDTALVTKPK